MPTNIDTHDLDATSGAVYFAVVVPKVAPPPTIWPSPASPRA